MGTKLTVEETLDRALALLKNASDTARLDAEILLAFCLNKNTTWLKTWPNKEITSAQYQDFQAMLFRRSQAEPVAYITGSKDFWSLKLKVTKDTLVPRPETELLVELALKKIPTQQRSEKDGVEKGATEKVIAEKDTSASCITKEPFIIADLGTGTGAIALSIAKEQPLIKVIAVDFSKEALNVSEENARTNQVTNVEFKYNNWLLDWPSDSLNMIVSNPPYVEEDDPHLLGLRHEPLMALVADEQGLADIRMITEQAVCALKKGGYLMFEHGFEQAKAVTEILLNNGFQDTKTYKDLAGLPRVTLGRLGY